MNYWVLCFIAGALLSMLYWFLVSCESKGENIFWKQVSIFLTKANLIFLFLFGLIICLEIVLDIEKGPLYYLDNLVVKLALLIFFSIEICAIFVKMFFRALEIFTQKNKNDATESSNNNNLLNAGQVKDYEFDTAKLRGFNEMIVEEDNVHTMVKPKSGS